jgi:hypothetical protein
VADNLASRFAGEAAGNLLRRPASGEPVKDGLAQAIVPFKPGAGPAPRSGLLLGIVRPIADLCAAGTLQLARNRRRLAIHSCSDLPDRLPGFAKPGNRTAFLDR